jgi:eukaryotic-like serine/threonine-protein kinase
VSRIPDRSFTCPAPYPSATGVEQTLAILDWKGALQRLKVPPKAYGGFLPTASRLQLSTDNGKDSNVWIIDFSGTTAPRQLTLGGANRYPIWSSDGKRVAFQSDREGDPGIFWQAADGTGTAERFTKPEQGTAHIPDSWSPDGQRFSYTAAKGSETSVWIFSLQDRRAAVFAEKSGSFIGRSAFSPDGQWLAYQSTEAGPNQIFVQPFPATGTKYPVVRGGHPFWSLDGQAIIFNPARGQLGIVSISTKPKLSFSEPVLMPGGLHGLNSKNPATDPRIWDIATDGKSILGTIPAASGDEGSNGKCYTANSSSSELV